MEMKEGMKAPEFTLPGSHGKNVALSDYGGKNVILYFYPKDNTKGCTLEATNFRDYYLEFQKANTEILGVNKDSIKSHTSFSEKYHLPFLLLSDESGKVCDLYGVWKKKIIYDREYMGIERTTFLIDSQGIITKIYFRVKVPGHIEVILTQLKANQQGNR